MEWGIYSGKDISITLFQQIRRLIGLLDIRKVPFESLERDLRLKNLEVPSHAWVLQDLRLKIEELLKSVVSRLDQSQIQNLVNKA